LSKQSKNPVSRPVAAEPESGVKRAGIAVPIQSDQAADASVAFRTTFTHRLLELLTDANVAEEGRASVLAGMTKRTRQTTTGWINGQTVPDLYSFRSILQATDGDAYYLLDLSTRPAKQLLSRPTQAVAGDLIPFREAGFVLVALGPSPKVVWLGRTLVSNVEDLFFLANLGDAMDPVIRHNDIVGIDTSSPKIQGNGVYLMARRGQPYVRRIEEHIEGGYTIRCANQAHDSYRVKGDDDPLWQDVKVVGRVICVVKPVDEP
jgi:hypothetical protein